MGAQRWVIPALTAVGEVQSRRELVAPSPTPPRMRRGFKLEIPLRMLRLPRLRPPCPWGCHLVPALPVPSGLMFVSAGVIPEHPNPWVPFAELLLVSDWAAGA